MRIRKKAWAQPELDSSDFYIQKPQEYKGKWREKFKKIAPIYLELGCGKGFFASEFGVRHKNVNLLAIDIKSEILALAKREIESVYENHSEKIDNILLTAQNIEQITDILDKEDKVERIYINFCNPWPKPKHKKRRLTHIRQLEKYKSFLKENSEIFFKTDDDLLFKESKNYFEESGFDIIWETHDLHTKSWGENIETEHEKMYLQKGVKIKALIAKLKAGEPISDSPGSGLALLLR